MAPSGREDSKLELKLTAETAPATQGVEAASRDIAGALRGVARAAEEAGSGAADAMEKVAQKSREAAAEVKKVGEHAKMSAGQLRMVAVGMAGMALNAYGAWQDNHGGRSAATAYAQSALGSGAQGAMMGMMLGGPVGAAIGGVAGAAVGAFTAYQQREAAEKAEQKAREESIKSMREQVDLYESLRARTASFQKTLETLGNTEGDVASRTEARDREIARREAEDARLAEAQRAAAGRGDQAAFRDLTRDRQLNAQELSALRNLKIEVKAPERRERTGYDPSEGDSFLKRGWNLFGGIGGGVNDAATQLAREGNDIARQQLSTLNRIATQRTASGWVP